MPSSISKSGLFFLLYKLISFNPTGGINDALDSSNTLPYTPSQQPSPAEKTTGKTLKPIQMLPHSMDFPGIPSDESSKYFSPLNLDFQY